MRLTRSVGESEVNPEKEYEKREEGKRAGKREEERKKKGRDERAGSPAAGIA